MDKEPGGIAIKAEEEKQLRRVFDLLCDYHSKRRIEEEVGVIRSDAKMKAAGLNEILDLKSSCWQAMNELPDSRLEGIRKEISELRSPRIVRKVTPEDVQAMLRRLEHRASRKEVEEMVWEVDEDLDGALSWQEFRLVFTRNIRDRTGLEPNRVFNLAQFLMYDTDLDGRVSMDDTLPMLCIRYGKKELESKLKEIFGPQAGTRVGEGGIGFSEYAAAVEAVQMQQYRRSPAGQLPTNK